MRSSLIFAKRNLKESLRDPVSLVFCLIFPVFMLVVMELIFNSMEVGPEMFRIENYAPGIAVFGYSFTMLMSALTIAGDRNSAFMSRIKTAPVSEWAYLMSFVISQLPVMIVQTVLFYAIAFIFGLPFTVGTFVSVIYLIPAMLFYSVCGIFVGVTVKSNQQAGPICSIMISATGLLGGVWLPLEMIGGGLQTACRCLPFYNGVLLGKNAICNNFGVFPELLIVLGYTAVLAVISVFVYNKTKRN